ncbi:4-hydroxy-3-methylbut-2-enyl diphosphate reductase [Limihaloglobus sulfuriphilus]|uniref:4-hydroxy-3-methylbut-2-enyl diphosphate reductase n=1 Tax=Limihaloglobus sulfuriphilus TaxID=1851148 RepID=A0A1Q2MD52_9BACT|nr:4-hydroxy-3-methylbut-2-enyl diphosphate reductase [Limihaloglobus sulfuriphilus]AQQ70621.1 4-hydroxy-3-methylbut-2-enyl diphosphate reductase [Limihaloglobus sulfuriphilus]
MNVLVAEKCGFCQGVRRAIQIANKTLEANGTVYSLGPIIHNTDVVKSLEDKGLTTISDIDNLQNGTVLTRSHGATPDQLERIVDNGLDLVDGTCSFVKHVQLVAKSLEKEGYSVVIIGDAGHPEVQALAGSVKQSTVVRDESELDKLPNRMKLGIISQTTQSKEHFAEMTALIMKRGFKEIKVVNTLCKEASKRQEAAVELAGRVEVMFVLGGRHSANTKKLADLCKIKNKNTFHLQNWSEIDKRIVSGFQTAGVTAGASTPDWVINEFVENLKKL